MYDPSKGVIAIATGYSGGKYTYSKINHDLLQPDTMKSTPDQMQDLDTYINGKGVSETYSNGAFTFKVGMQHMHADRKAMDINM